MRNQIVRIGPREKAAEFAETARRYAAADRLGLAGVAGWKRVVANLPADGDYAATIAAYRAGFPSITYDPLAIECECCGVKVDIAIRVNTAHTDEYGPSEFCATCVGRMAEALR